MGPDARYLNVLLTDGDVGAACPFLLAPEWALTGASAACIMARTQSPNVYSANE